MLERQALSAKVLYVPYAKHKKHPDAYGLKPYTGDDEDPTFCDAHAGFKPADMPRIPAILQRGIAAGLFGKSLKKGDPGIFWSVDDNGWIFEAQITNPGYGVYHGYPILPVEAIAQKVLLRYADYVTEQKDPVLNASLEAARKRYQ